jgi:hypothetical protein
MTTATPAAPIRRTYFIRTTTKDGATRVQGPFCSTCHHLETNCRCAS